MFQSKSWKISYDTKRKRSKDIPDRVSNQLIMCDLRSGCQPILDIVDETKLIAGSVNTQYWLLHVGNSAFHETIISKKKKVTL